MASGGVLKRSLGEVERWQQALYLRAVRQRVAAQAQTPHQPPGIGGSGFSGLASDAFAAGVSPSPQPSSTLSSITTSSRVETTSPPMQQLLQRQRVAASSATPQASQAMRRATPRELVLLQELEKQLLGDDDDGVSEAGGSACGSTVTGSSAWVGDTIQQELSSIAAAPLPTSNSYGAVPAMSRSPSRSSSSTASSAASSSPPTSAASSRQLLSEAAAAIAEGNHAAAAAHLAVLKTSVNPRARGDAEQRLVATMAAALSSRIGPPSPQHLALADLCGAEHRAAWQLLHDVSPCFGLALHGANLAILSRRPTVGRSPSAPGLPPVACRARLLARLGTHPTAAAARHGTHPTARRRRPRPWALPCASRSPPLAALVPAPLRSSAPA